MVALDLSPFFKRYEALVAEVDAIFRRVEAAHPDCVKCGPGCSDCCHALFDLGLVEALYLNQVFNETFSGQERSTVLTRADEADREGFRIRREAFKLSRDGASTAEIMDFIGRERVRCPLLDGEDRCVLYEHRPVTCRLYGIPTAVNGKAHSCAKTGFEAGGKYPTVQIEKIQDRLAMLASELTASIRTRLTELHRTFVPVSMALMTTFDEEYLGVIGDEEWEKLRKLSEAIGGPGGGPAPAAVDGGEAPSPCASCKEGKGSDACSTCGSLSWDLGGSGGTAR